MENEDIKVINEKNPKSKFKIWKIVFWIFVIFNPITIITILKPDPYEFGALIAFIVVSAIWIFVAILTTISFFILKRKEKDGIVYNQNDRPILILIIKTISIIFLLIAIISSIAYIIPLIKNYSSFKFIESNLSQYTISIFGVSSDLYIRNILVDSYIIIRCIIMFVAFLVLYLIYLKKYSVSKVFFLWLLATILIFFNSFLLDTSVYTKDNINKIRSYRIQRIIKFENAMKNGSCSEIISNAADKFYCEASLKQYNLNR